MEEEAGQQHDFMGGVVSTLVKTVELEGGGFFFFFLFFFPFQTFQVTLLRVALHVQKCHAELKASNFLQRF